MKLQVTQENLSKALSSVAKVANSRNTLPILGNVLIKAEDNRLVVSATNLDIAISHNIGSKMSEPGSITVPARLMQDFVSSLPGGVIDLELDDTKLKISTDKYNSTINGTSSEDFPVMPAINGGKSWQIPSSVFKKSLQQTVFTASSDDTRPVLTGLYIHTHNGKLYIASTDSYRLAEKELNANKEEVSLLVPSSAMQDMLRILGDGEDVVTVTHDDQQVLFSVGEIELVSRLIDGKYPDYRKLIPKNFEVTAKLKKDDFTNITKVSSLFARESAGSITIKVEESSGQVSIRSVASQLGDNTSSANAEVSGSGEVTLNSRYLLDALHALSGEEVTFSFNGRVDPCLITDNSSSDYKHIVMPLRS